MTKREQIEALRREVAELKGRIVALEARQPVVIPMAPGPPMPSPPFVPTCVPGTLPTRSPNICSSARAKYLAANFDRIPA